MKNIRTINVIVLLFCLFQVSYSQGFSTEIYSGTNFSNIHGQPFGGKWKAKPGPSAGLNVKYSLSRVVGFESGINYSTVYYEHVTQHMAYPGPTYYDITSFRLSYIAPYYYPGSSRMDFSFIRVPLLFTLTVPSTIRFTMKAGIFYSFLTGHNTYNSYPYYPYYPYLNSYYPGSYFPTEVKPEKRDFGYMFSSGISYPLSDKFSASLNASFITGRKPFFENYTYKHASSEITLGLQYTGFLKKKDHELSENPDSSHVIVTLSGGYDYSWNGGKEPNGSYNGMAGPYFGFSLKVPLGRSAFFQTGFSFERKGFSMKDSSTVFYRLGEGPGMKYYVDSKVQVDYAIIPALLTLSFGKGEHVFFSTGPWLGLKLNARNVGTAINDQHSPSDYQLRKTNIYDDIEEYITKTDAGWLAAMGVKFPVLKNDVEFSVRYSGGFKDVFSGMNDKQNYNDPGLILKNRTVSFVLGVTLPYNE